MIEIQKSKKEHIRSRLAEALAEEIYHLEKAEERFAHQKKLLMSRLKKEYVENELSPFDFSYRDINGNVDDVVVFEEKKVVEQDINFVKLKKILSEEDYQLLLIKIKKTIQKTVKTNVLRKVVLNRRITRDVLLKKL
jgi:hypothetical protein